MTPALLPKGMEKQFEVFARTPARGDLCLFWFNRSVRLVVVIDHVSHGIVRIRCEGYHVDVPTDRLTIMPTGDPS